MSAELPTILVVDDLEDNRYTLLRRLRRDGFGDALQAASGREALALLEHRVVDLVLLDIMMPELDGFAVLHRMRADPRLRDVPVIVISAVEELDSVVACIKLGADDYIQKPFNAVLLKARVQASLTRKQLADRQAEHLRRIEEERQRADCLLHAILPAEAVRELKASDAVRPRRYDDVAILFGDLVGFTPYCDTHPPEQAVAELGALIGRFEDITAAHGLEKIKTVGDAYMATGGLLRPVDAPVDACIAAGRDMLRAAAASPWQLRLAVHRGPVVAGVMGRRQFLFDLWGDTVNAAARVLDQATPGLVTVTGEAWAVVARRCGGRSRGQVALRGRGPVELIEVSDPA